MYLYNKTCITACVIAMASLVNTEMLTYPLPDYTNCEPTQSIADYLEVLMTYFIIVIIVMVMINGCIHHRSMLHYKEIQNQFSRANEKTQSENLSPLQSRKQNTQEGETKSTPEAITNRVFKLPVSSTSNHIHTNNKGALSMRVNSIQFKQR